MSAGILGYRAGRHGIEVLLVHPGGPYWRNKDDGAWSIYFSTVLPATLDKPTTSSALSTESNTPCPRLLSHIEASGEGRCLAPKEPIEDCDRDDR